MFCFLGLQQEFTTYLFFFTGPLATAPVTASPVGNLNVLFGSDRVVDKQLLTSLSLLDIHPVSMGHPVSIMLFNLVDGLLIHCVVLDREPVQ